MGKQIKNFKNYITEKMDVNNYKVSDFVMMLENDSLSNIEDSITDPSNSSFFTDERFKQLYFLSAEYGRADVMKLIARIDLGFDKRGYNERANQWLVYSRKFHKLSEDVRKSVTDIIGQISANNHQRVAGSPGSTDDDFKRTL